MIRKRFRFLSKKSFPFFELFSKNIFNCLSQQTFLHYLLDCNYSSFLRKDLTIFNHPTIKKSPPNGVTNQMFFAFTPNVIA